MPASLSIFPVPPAPQLCESPPCWAAQRLVPEEGPPAPALPGGLSAHCRVRVRGADWGALCHPTDHSRPLHPHPAPHTGFSKALSSSTLLIGICLKKLRGRQADVGGAGGRRCAPFQRLQVPEPCPPPRDGCGVTCTRHVLPASHSVLGTAPRAPGIHKAFELPATLDHRSLSQTRARVSEQSSGLPRLSPQALLKLNAKVDFPSKAEVVCRLPSRKLFLPVLKETQEERHRLPQKKTPVESDWCLNLAQAPGSNHVKDRVFISVSERREHALR